MSESELSHRGLMKMANAKLDYLLELRKIDGFIAKNGETEEVNRYATAVEEKYKSRVRQIYAEDKMINLERSK